MENLAQKRFQRLTRWAKAITLLLFLLGLLSSVVVPYLLFTDPQPSVGLTMLGGNTIPLAALTFSTKVMLLVYTGGTVNLLLAILFSAWCLFRLYAEGKFFERAVVQQYTRLGILMTIVWATVVLELPITLYIVSLNSDAVPGWHLQFDFGLPWLFCAVLLNMLAFIMGEGNRLKEEQELTI